MRLLVLSLYQLFCKVLPRLFFRGVEFLFDFVSPLKIHTALKRTCVGRSSVGLH